MPARRRNTDQSGSHRRIGSFSHSFSERRAFRTRRFHRSAHGRSRRPSPAAACGRGRGEPQPEWRDQLPCRPHSAAGARPRRLLPGYSANSTVRFKALSWSENGGYEVTAGDQGVTGILEIGQQIERLVEVIPDDPRRPPVSPSVSPLSSRPKALSRPRRRCDQSVTSEPVGGGVCAG